MVVNRSLFALALGLAPGLSLAADYFGILKLPESSLARGGLYSFFEPASVISMPMFGLEKGSRVRLGYKYSRYLAVETEYVDFGRNSASVFASPGNFSSQFRSTGLGVDAVAMLPVWRFSFYGRMGAYRGDARGFNFGSTALVPASAYSRDVRSRYGVGVRYDFSNSFGIRAELERHAPVAASLAGEVENGDQVSVGLSWRF